MSEKELIDTIDYSKILKQKHYSKGSVYLLYMTKGMWLVVGFNDYNETIERKLFCYNNNIKKYVWKSCLSFYKNIKNVLIKKGC